MHEHALSRRVVEDDLPLCHVIIIYEKIQLRKFFVDVITYHVIISSVAYLRVVGFRVICNNAAASTGNGEYFLMAIAEQKSIVDIRESDYIVVP